MKFFGNLLKGLGFDDDTQDGSKKVQTEFDECNAEFFSCSKESESHSVKTDIESCAESTNFADFQGNKITEKNIINQEMQSKDSLLEILDDDNTDFLQSFENYKSKNRTENKIENYVEEQTKNNQTRNYLEEQTKYANDDYIKEEYNQKLFDIAKKYKDGQIAEVCKLCSQIDVQNFVANNIKTNCYIELKNMANEDYCRSMDFLLGALCALGYDAFEIQDKVYFLTRKGEM